MVSAVLLSCFVVIVFAPFLAMGGPVRKPTPSAIFTVAFPDKKGIMEVLFKDSTGWSWRQL
jgi:hypothetical protein